MPFVEAVCTSCGAGLQVDSAKEAAICPFCGKPYIVQDAVNNYNNTINNYSHIDNLSANNVVLNDDRSAEQRLRAAEQNMQFREYDKALAIFREVTDIAPHDYRCWWGCVQAGTQDFQRGAEGDINTLRSFLSQTAEDANKALMTAPDNQKETIRQTYNAYCDTLNESVARRAEEQARRAADLQNEISEKHRQIQEAQDNADQYKAEKAEVDKQNSNCSIVPELPVLRTISLIVGLFFVVLTVFSGIGGHLSDTPAYVWLIIIVCIGFPIAWPIIHKVSERNYYEDTARLSKESESLRQKADQELSKAHNLREAVDGGPYVYQETLSQQLDDMKALLNDLRNMKLEKLR